MPGPLAGIRILDLTQWQQGPAATVMLADLGAEVIKIEHPASGDPGRKMKPILEVMLGGKVDFNFFFESYNRNKKSITLDLTKQKGREVLYCLVKKSDVFVHNLRKAAVGRLRVDYETLIGYNPKLIYVAISGLGAVGPESEKPALDMVAQARSGIMTTIGEPDAPPTPGPPGVADQVGAIIAAFGMVAALLARERTGTGQKIETSLLSSMSWLQQFLIELELNLGRKLPRFGRKEQGNPLWNYYQCQDGQWLMLAMIDPDKYWADFCKTIDRKDLITNPKFENMFKRAENHLELIEVLEQVFASKPQGEWLKIFNQSGDFIVGPVNTLSDLAHDPQVVANRYIIDFHHPVAGLVKVVAPPVSFSQTPARLESAAPQLGQHTEEVLLKIGGYTQQEIKTLKKAKVI